MKRMLVFLKSQMGLFGDDAGEHYSGLVEKPIHVKQHTRTTHDGQVVNVTEHDERRNVRGESGPIEHHPYTARFGGDGANAYSDYAYAHVKHRDAERGITIFHDTEDEPLDSAGAAAARAAGHDPSQLRKVSGETGRGYEIADMALPAEFLSKVREEVSRRQAIIDARPHVRMKRYIEHDRFLRRKFEYHDKQVKEARDHRSPVHAELKERLIELAKVQGEINALDSAYPGMREEVKRMRKERRGSRSGETV